MPSAIFRVSLISSRTLRKTSSFSSSLPSAAAGSSKGRLIELTAPPVRAGAFSGGLFANADDNVRSGLVAREEDVHGLGLLG